MGGLAERAAGCVEVQRRRAAEAPGKRNTTQSLSAAAFHMHAGQAPHAPAALTWQSGACGWRRAGAKTPSPAGARAGSQTRRTPRSRRCRHPTHRRPPRPARWPPSARRPPPERHAARGAARPWASGGRRSAAGGARRCCLAPRPRARCCPGVGQGQLAAGPGLGTPWDGRALCPPSLGCWGGALRLLWPQFDCWSLLPRCQGAAGPKEARKSGAAWGSGLGALRLLTLCSSAARYGLGLAGAPKPSPVGPRISALLDGSQNPP